MAEDDRLAHLLGELGEPSQPRKLTNIDAKKYQGRVPQNLINFWVDHGFGSYKNKFFTLCDPIAFDPIVRTIFKGDSEIDANDVSIVGYTCSSNADLLMWHRDGRNIGAYPNVSELSISPELSKIDKDSGLPFSQEYLVGALITSFMEYDTEIFEEDVTKVGPLGEGQVIGYVPALQLGGGEDDLQRVQALEYFGFLSQLQPYKVMALTPSKPGYPYGERRFVRYAGPKPQ